MADFRKMFSEYLVVKEITQAEAAEKMGMTQQAISGLINSEHPVRYKTKTRVYSVFPEFKLIFEGKIPFPTSSLSDTSVMAGSNLDIVIYIENHINEFKVMPEFIRMCFRITKEFGMYDELRKDLEDIKQKLKG